MRGIIIVAATLDREQLNELLIVLKDSYQKIQQYSNNPLLPPEVRYAAMIELQFIKSQIELIETELSDSKRKMN